MKQQNSGKITELASIDTVFSNNEYYLLCQGARNSNDCIQYRLDYIKDVEIIKDSSIYFSSTELENFHEKLKNMTYMYGEGSIEVIELEFKNYVYANIIDKFGKNINPHKINDNTYKIHIKHLINNTFYSWLIGFWGAIKISGNENQVQKFKDFLTKILFNLQS